ncbi:peptide-methionine (R)-S-oxide reductase, partial [Streptomyces sp. JAC128]|uniref:peptide-methionine (R)-S-oxide reductase n=1 Tax=Streptomyces sp. JAC128 TaxID=3418412 RepID=UPI003D8153ED
MSPTSARRSWTSCRAEGATGSYDGEKPDEQGRAELTPAEYAVLRKAGAEPAFVGEYTDTRTAGVYSCRAWG